MATVGFIGLGNMGGPMAINLAKAGHTVKAFDLSGEAIQRVVSEGGVAASSAKGLDREGAGWGGNPRGGRAAAGRTWANPPPRRFSSGCRRSPKQS